MLKEHTTRALRAIDGPSSSVIFTLIESEGILYVSIKTQPGGTDEQVHVVDAVHFIWAASDIRLDPAYQEKAGHLHVDEVKELWKLYKGGQS